MRHILLFIFGLLLCSCVNDRADKECVNSLDSIERAKPYNPFNIDNEIDKQRLFTLISTVVDSTIKVSNLEYNPATLQGYAVWDSITNMLYSPDNFIHTSDSDWDKNENEIIEYLNWYLWNTITRYIRDQYVLDKMNEEMALTDSLLKAQYCWLNSHFDTTEEQIGTAYQFKYYAIEREMLKIQNKNLCELLEAFSDSTY